MSFQIIYADPPWAYTDTASAGQRGAVHKYPVMTLPQIAALPVEALAAPEGAVLFMWATFPMLPEALEVVKAWGFNYKTMGFVWVKKTVTGKDAFGMGNWTRANPEPCLLAVRGKGYPRRIAKHIRQQQYPQIGRHSEKPDLFRRLIVELLGDLPRVELFARQRVTGWSAWGNEVESDVQMGGQP